MRFRSEQHVRRQRDFRNLREKGRRFDCGGFAFWHYKRAADEAGTSGRAGVGPVTSLETPKPPRSSHDIHGGFGETALPANRPAQTPVRAADEAASRADVPPEITRLAVVASYAAVGNAVKRARAKRRLREVFRRNQQLVPAGHDVMLVAKRSLNDAKFSVIEQKFADACRRVFQK